MEIKLLLIFLALLLIVIGYFGIQAKDVNIKKEIKEDDLEIAFKNAGIGSSEEILKQQEMWENQFEQKPGEIYDNIFNGQIIGLLSS